MHLFDYFLVLAEKRFNHHPEIAKQVQYMKRDQQYEQEKIVRRPYFINELIKPYKDSIKDSINLHFQYHFKQRLINKDFIQVRAV